MTHFAILTHDWPVPHWDFLVEAGSVLRTWRLLAEPQVDADIVAEPNFDHRLFYLDYEGPLSGERGSVTRWDAGECDWLADEAECVEVELRGAKLAGRAAIRREGGAWVFRFTAAG